jgi:methionyl-tRNA formyltransferase
MENKLNVIFFGTPSFVISVVEELAKNCNLLAIITTPDQPAGRKQILTASPIKQYSLEHHIPVITPQKLTQEFESEIRNLKSEIDFFIVAAYGKIIPQNILDIPKYGTLNIHPSLLPQYRGPSPLQSAILNGDTETAVSIMKLDAQMDHGPILQTKKLPINQQDTFETLAEKAFKAGANLLPKIMKNYADGKLSPQEQDHEKATYTQRITKETGYIDFKLLAKCNPVEIDRKIRAFYPWPGVWTKVILNNQEKILKLLPDQKLQLEGKKPMTKKDFFNGYPELKHLAELI